MMDYELSDTVELMCSKDYKERFRAEYHQLLIRYEKLRLMVSEWDYGKLTFTPTCPREIYERQIKAMIAYIGALEKRAEIENVTL